MVEGLHRLRRQMISTTEIGRDGKYRRKSCVVLLADEEQAIDATTPSSKDVNCLRLMIRWIGHDPREDANLTATCFELRVKIAFG